MKKFPDPDKLRKAAEAVEKYETQRAKLADKQGEARVAEGEVRLQEVHTDIAAREVDLHLADTFPSGEETPANIGGSGGGNLRPPSMISSVGELPDWWARPSGVAALIAIFLALIALVWLAFNHGDWSAGKQAGDTALTVAETADAKADKALSLGEANTKTLKGHDERITQGQQTADDALAKVKDCGCDKKEQPKVPVVRKKPRQPAVSPVPAPVSPPKVQAPAPTAPPPAAALKPGGCIYVSDGAAILKGTTVRQPAGTELARISDESLRASPVPEIRSILRSHPEAFVTDQGHLSMCNAWSNYVAGTVQIPDGLRVNNDTRRVSN